MIFGWLVTQIVPTFLKSGTSRKCYILNTGQHRIFICNLAFLDIGFI